MKYIKMDELLRGMTQIGLVLRIAGDYRWPDTSYLRRERDVPAMGTPCRCIG